MSNFTTLSASFQKTNFAEYTYKVPRSLARQLKKGDLIVVPTRDTFQVAWVTAVHPDPRLDPEAKFEYKWVAQKVDLTAYNELTQEPGKAPE